MSYEKFLISVKSTLDKEINALATAKAIHYFDVDTAFMDENFLKSKSAALGWSFSTMDPVPIDPMYMAEFQVCAKSSLDPAQYARFDTASAVVAHFYQGLVIPVRDYSGTTQPTVDQGSISIVACSMLPNQFEQLAGYRFINVRAAVLRWV